MSNSRLNIPNNGYFEVQTQFSVIIPAYNEAQYLDDTLKAISQAILFYGRMTNNKAEIIVVDNASTDQTAKICQNFNVKLLSESKRQIAACRNRGAKEAVGYFLLFVDADTKIPENALLEIENTLLFSSSIGGSAKLRPDRITVISKFFYTFWNLFSLFFHFKGAILYCDRENFFKVNGFDETLYALEDVKFVFELKRIAKKLNKKFTSNGKFEVITASRKFRTIKLSKIINLCWNILINPTTFYRKKEILDCWFYSVREDIQS